MCHHTRRTASMFALPVSCYSALSVGLVVFLFYSVLLALNRTGCEAVTSLFHFLAPATDQLIWATMEMTATSFTILPVLK